MRTTNFALMDEEKELWYHMGDETSQSPYSTGYLISYRAEPQAGDTRSVSYGYDIADDPIEWVEEMQQFSETYILLNAQPMTAEQVKKYTGMWKGM